MDAEGFRQLLRTVAEAWNEGDTPTALACFAEDARYTEPPDTQHYEGRQALYEFFGGEDPPPMRMVWHTVEAIRRLKDTGCRQAIAEATQKISNWGRVSTPTTARTPTTGSR